MLTSLQKLHPQSCNLNISRDGYSIKQILQSISGCMLSLESSPELLTGLTITLYPTTDDPAVESLLQDAI